MTKCRFLVTFNFVNGHFNAKSFREGMRQLISIIQYKRESNLILNI